MAHTDYQVSESICLSADSTYEIACINPRGQLAPNNGAAHGDFFLACADIETTPLETPYPSLDNYPRDDECSSEGKFKAFYESNTDYDHVDSLIGRDGAENAVLQWSVDHDNNVFRGKLSFDGLFGWLSFGLAGPDDSPHPGMSGANVLLAKPGGNYSAVTGLDLSLGTDIGYYHVHDVESAFRHWQNDSSGVVSIAKVRSTSDEDAKLELIEEDCFTALVFEVSSFYGQALDFTGINKFVWAANEMDYYVGYHGAYRGKIDIDFTGAGSSIAAEEDDNNEEKESENAKDEAPAVKNDEGNVAAVSSPASAVSALLVGAVLALLG